MAQLLVRNIPDSLVKKLKLRASKNGISTEEEHRRILKQALAVPAAAKPKRTLLDALRELGEIAPDIEFEPDRKKNWGMRDLEL